MSEQASVPAEPGLNEWAEGLVKRGAMVLALGTCVVGQVEDYFDGQRKMARGADGRPVPSPVLQVAGHTMLAKRDHFVELNETESLFFLNASAAVGASLTGFAVMAQATGMDKMKAKQLLKVVLQSQLRAVGAA